MKPGLIIAISLFTVSLSGQAATPTLESCAAIEHPVERLACYDTLSGRLPADTTKAGGTPGADIAVPAAPAAAPTVSAVETKPDAETVFGFEHKKKPEKNQPDELKLKWTSKKEDAHGKWIITLENGQVWQQTDSRRFLFENTEHWVIVYRGFAGGFILGEPESHMRIRVKRLR